MKLTKNCLVSSILTDHNKLTRGLACCTKLIFHLGIKKHSFLFIESCLQYCNTIKIMKKQVNNDYFRDVLKYMGLLVIKRNRISILDKLWILYITYDQSWNKIINIATVGRSSQYVDRTNEPFGENGIRAIRKWYSRCRRSYELN